MNKKITAVIFIVIIILFISWYYFFQKDIQEVSISFGDSPLVTERMPEPSTYSNLTSYVWIWKETHSGTGPTSLSVAKIIPNKAEAFTIVFGDDGKISGTTDCNNFSGTYILNSGEITFGSIVSTLKFCEGSQEAEFLAMIKKGGLAIGENNLYIEHNQTVIFDRGDEI